MLKNPQKRVEALKDGLENLTSLTQEFIKLSLYISVLVIITSLLIQWPRRIGVEEPSAKPDQLGSRNVPGEYLLSKRTIGVYKTDQQRLEKEKHFGQLLPVDNEHRDSENEERHVVQTRKLLHTFSRKTIDTVRGMFIVLICVN